MKHLFSFAAVVLSLTINAQWDTLPTGVNLNFRGIAFHNESSGIAVGNNADGSGNGTALITTDRGNTWTLYWWLGVNSGGEFHDVIMTPSSNVWIIGDSGRFLHKTFPAPINISEGFISSATLLCGAAPNDSVFYCAGQYGALYRTADRGLTWDTLSSGTGENINDIYFADAANGWVVADGGYMAVTADSGNTWTHVAQPQWGFANIHSIDYQDTLGVNPYFVGNTGQAMFSIDGGVNWAPIATGTTQSLNRIRFGTTNAGIIAGHGGTILRTNNGGGSWFGETSPRNVNLYDIAFGDTTAYICGDSGVVLRSSVDISSVQPFGANRLSANAYPNPSDGPLFVAIDLQQAGDVHIELLTANGQVVQQSVYNNVQTGVNRFDVNTEELAAGFYLLRVVCGESSATVPVIRN